MTTRNLIGQYRILRVIGAGGMGAVYLGEHLLLKRRAAIKTLLPEHSRDRAIADWFFHEARATSALSDPGVVQIFDFGYQVDGTAYIVMEYLTGETLAERIVRLGRLPVGYALRLARQVASSLAVAHAAGVVHCDLKPANVFLVRDSETEGGERTKILDFGFCGTPVYMSPEQCRRVPADHRADIYALGCTLFEMITGRPPFAGVTSDDYIAAHLEQTPEPPSAFAEGVPQAVDEIVLRCLAKDPDQRFASMDELRLAIDPLLPTIADPPVAVDREPAPSRAALGDGFRSAYVAPATVSEQAWFDDASDPPLVERRVLRPLHRIVIAAAAIATLGIMGVAIWMALDRDDAHSAAVAPPLQTIAEPTPAIAPPPQAIAEPAPPVAPPPQAVAEPPPPAAEPEPVAPPPVAKPVAPTPRRPVVARPRPPQHHPAAPATEDLYDTR